MSLPVFFLLKAIPAGARWITVHPNGGGDKGQPVLIQPAADGSARVIGGAGGHLNYLKLRAVKNVADYRKEAAARRSAAADERRAQRARDKQAGILESKTAARRAVAGQRVAGERKFLAATAQAAGWDPRALDFTPPDGVSDAVANRLTVQHHRDLMRRALAVVDAQRKRLATDADARQEAGLGDIRVMAADPDTLTVQDIAPLAEAETGLGFTPNYGRRAEAAGAVDIRDEAAAVRQAEQTDDQRLAAVRRGDTAKMVRKEMQALREPVPDDAIRADLMAARTAGALLKAAKELQSITRQARDAGRKIDAATTAPEPKAFVLAYTADPDLDAKVRQDLDDELRTARTSAFLSEFNRLGGEAPEETLGKHIGVGAYNSINSLALAVGGHAMVDRSVVDVLGIAGASQALARRIRADLAEDVARIADGMEEFHVNHYMATSESAMTRAKKLMAAAKEIEIGDAADGADLETGQELNARRRHAVVDAQRTLGEALGEMEANAALVAALRGSDGDIEVPMGKLGIEDVITRARAIGLQRGDYSVKTGAGGVFLAVNGTGQDRLAAPVSRADIEQVRRNLDIIGGRHDEDDWLPAGVARRPDLAMTVKPGVAPRLAEPFAPGADLHQSLKDYIGGRAADGDTPADIVADIWSQDFFQKAGDVDAYRKALDAISPLGADGKPRRAEEFSDAFDGYADDFVRQRYGGSRSALNRQHVAVDQIAIDALHRALAEHPDGVAAYKQIGELTAQDQNALREAFHRDVVKESEEAGDLRRAAEAHAAAEPEAKVEDMFGDVADNPEHQAWKTRRDELTAKANAAGLDWPRYVAAMGSREKAYEAVQDLIKSGIAKSFADAHNRLRPAAPIKLGRAVIRNDLNHLDATDHEARDARQARNRELIDGLRDRDMGRYAAGGVADKIDAARDQREAFEQSQMGFFSSEEEPVGAADKPLAGGERHTLGHVAERQIAAMIGTVGANFKPGQPLRIFAPSMSGGDNFARQRAIKLLAANKRVGLHLGAGSGKTLVGMAGFTHLKEHGKVRRAVFAVPSIVQGQFGGEALRFLEPGRYRWHCEPGASRDQRIAAYKNAAQDFVVVTHQALRDDMIHLGAKQAGSSEDAMRDRVAAMTRGERKAWFAGVMKAEGIDFDYSVVDEGHNLLDRQGKTDSGMSMTIGAMTDNTPYHVSMTADPVRNDDASEVFSALQKVDPDRYADRDAFMRRYGVDTLASKDALRREMARYFYSHSIQPAVRADRKTVNVKLSDGQHQALAAVDKDIAAMRLARMGGRVAVDAARRVMPEAFAGADVDAEAVARGLQSALGVVRETAVRRVVNDHPESAKTDEVVRQIRARPGKPGIVFARSLHAVENLRQRLEAEGMRVVTITGADSSAEKDRKRRMFSPDNGDAEADVLVASDAASTGLNAQRGQWVMQYDIPQTAMTHAQRNARVHRIGQRNDVELIDIVADHASERRALDRLSRKYAMRDVMSSPLEGMDDSGIAFFLKQRHGLQTALV